MGFLGDLFKDPFDKWIENASDEELSSEYENYRQQWISNNEKGIGNGEPLPEMDKINSEMGRRSKERWEKDPNRDPNYRWTDKNRWE